MTSAQLAALSDVEAVGLTIWGEARGEPVQGRIAVGCVIRNRVLHPRRWSRNWRRVCHQRWQFSCWLKAGGAANHARVATWAAWYGMDDLLAAKPTNDPDGVREALWLAEGLISGQCRDITAGADHYFAPRAMVPRGTVPSWADEKKRVATVGGHRFYKLA